MSRTPEMRRIAETTRSSCFLSRTSTVMSTIAPSVGGCHRWRASRLRMLVCSLNSAVRQLVQHAGPILGVDQHLHRERLRGAAGPLDVDLALHFVHQVLNVGAIQRMDRDALAARHVADDGFARESDCSTWRDTPADRRCL